MRLAHDCSRQTRLVSASRRPFLACPLPIPSQTPSHPHSSQANSTKRNSFNVEPAFWGDVGNGSGRWLGGSCKLSQEPFGLERLRLRSLSCRIEDSNELATFTICGWSSVSTTGQSCLLSKRRGHGTFTIPSAQPKNWRIGWGCHSVNSIGLPIREGSSASRNIPNCGITTIACCPKDLARCALSKRPSRD